jgi:RNA polymerase sigma-70 factor (ECF subfamily)
MRRDTHTLGAEEDRQAMSRLAAGDRSVIGSLYDRHARAVFSLAVRVLGNGADAEEIVQDVFSQVWSQAARFDAARGTFAAWVLMMTRSRAIDRLRARRAGAAALAADPVGEAADPIPTQEESVIAREDADRVRGALQDLNLSQRTAIELAYYEGLSQSEIAERLQEPLGTVKTRIRSGLLKLRAALQGVGHP